MSFPLSNLLLAKKKDTIIDIYGTDVPGVDIDSDFVPTGDERIYPTE